MSLNSSAQKVQDALDRAGLALTVVTFPASTRTAAEAAAAIGCHVDQIAKSLIFKSVTTNRPILVIASGSNRVNEQCIQTVLGEAIGRADADFVREHTGFAIGGVPPVGHPTPLITFIDRDLLVFPEIWAAAGTPNTVFCLKPADLVTLTKGQVVTVTN